MQKKQGNEALLNRVFKQVPIEDIITRLEKEIGLVTTRTPDTTTPLKVGDKVRVLKRRPSWGAAHPHFTDEMTELEGECIEVAGLGHIAVCAGGWNWRREWLDKVEE